MTMKRKITLLIGTMAMVVVLSSLKFETLEDKVSAMFLTYQKYNAQEKLYLHFDKPSYASGETAWFKVYLRNVSDLMFSRLSLTVYVELINTEREVIDTKLIFAGQDYASGDFVLPDDLASGVYSVRAYTNWMRNFDEELFYEKSFRVTAVNDTEVAAQLEETSDPNAASQIKEGGMTIASKVDLQFFPEGGQILDKISSRIAFRAVDKSGSPVVVKGVVKDAKGNEVTTFSSVHDGLGSLYLLPDAKNSYEVQLTEVNGQESTQRMPLPKVNITGVSLMAQQRPTGIVVQVAATPDIDLNQSTLVVSQGGELIVVKNIDKSTQSYTVSVPTSYVRDGIVQLTLFDAELRPRSERLVFVYEHYKNTSASLMLSQDKYKKREKIELELNVAAPKKSNVDASVSIVNSDHISPNDKRTSIISEFLLSSDLRGAIHNPRYYFEGYDAQKAKLLDLVMMTHGWRRYSWQDILSYQPKLNDFQIEKGISFLGQTTGWLAEDKEVQSQITASAFTDPLISDTLVTFANGKFYFSGYVFFDTTDFYFQAKRFNAKKGTAKNANNVTVNILENMAPEVGELDWVPGSVTADVIEKNRLARLKAAQVDSAFSLSNRVIILEGLVIEDEQINEDEQWALHSVADRTIDMTDVVATGTAWDMIRTRVEFARISRLLPNTSNNFFDSLGGGGDGTNVINGVVFILDGFEVSYDQLTTIMQSELKKVEVLYDFNATIYNSRATNGAVIMYSDPDRRIDTIVKGIGTVTHPGFYAQREFYSPNYEVKENEHTKTDLRSTLYWNPHFYTDENGKAKVVFHANDVPGEYLIEVEGITEDGIPFVTTKALTIR